MTLPHAHCHLLTLILSKLSTLEGIWALENPYTELSKYLGSEELDFLDQEVDFIVHAATPQTRPWDVRCLTPIHLVIKTH